MIDRVEGPNFDHAIVDPQSAFSHPQDIVRSKGISKHEKLSLLNRWKQTEEALVRAAGEGMTGGEPSVLKAVNDAIHDLG